MKLINTDKIINRIDAATEDEGGNIKVFSANDLKKLLNNEPIAYDVDKVVVQLENERKFWEIAYDRNLGKEKARSYEHAIDIVKAGGVDG